MFQSDIEKPINSSSASELLGHRPLKNTDNDALGYAQFAEELAKAIRRIAPRDGVVLALYGSWGSGKSTMLQFVETALRRPSDQDCPAIIRFNPWWLSGQEELTRVFFKELIRGLGQSALAKQGVDVKPLLQEIAKLSLKFVPGVGDDLSKIFDELTKEKPKTMEQARSEISDKLERVSSKILLIIDDIDRLTAEEIRLMFRLIKTVADFPNVIYLLAFDKRVVLSALGSEQASSEDYLAKIVQISFELPLPGQDALRTMLEQRLRKLLADTPRQLFDPFDWSSAYGNDVHRLGIGYFMRTPRDVVRLTDSVKLTYSAVKGKVNAVDFVIIETLRLHCPEVYDLIRDNPGAFSSEPRLGGNPLPGSGAPFPKERLESARQRIDKDAFERAKILLVQMFPKLPELRSSGGGVENASTRERQLGIWRRDVFPLYFQLCSPVVGIAPIDAIELCDNPESLRAELESALQDEDAKSGWLRPPDRVKPLLTWLSENIDASVVKQNARALFSVILDYGDLVPRGLSPLGSLLRQVAPDSRFVWLKEAVEKANFEMSVMLVHELGQLQGKYGSRPSADWTLLGEPTPINDEQLKSLEGTAAQRIEAASRRQATSGDYPLLKLSPQRLSLVLTCWYNWGGEIPVKKWGSEVGLARLLEAFYKEHEPVPPSLKPEWFSFFYPNLSDLEKAAKELKLLTGPQESARDTLLAEIQSKLRDPFGVLEYGTSRRAIIDQLDL